MNTLDDLLDEILRNRVKVIGDGEWTLLGTPNDTIQDLKASLIDYIDKEIIGEDLPMVQPLDNKLDPIQYEGNRLFRKGANWVKDEQRAKLKGKE
jgi:hypothetical protein